MPAFAMLKPVGKARPKGFTGTFTGPASYPSGGFTVTIGDLETVLDAVAIAGSGYLAEVSSISGNTVTVKVYYFDYGAAGPGPAIEVAAGTDLSTVTFRIIAVGE